MLTHRMPELARELVPAGRLHGREWVAGDLSGAPGRSLSIAVHGAKAGRWADFAAGLRGDALDLVAQALFCGDRKAAYRWSLRWLNIAEGAVPVPRRPVSIPASTDAADREAEGRRRAAARIFGMAQERIYGTPAGAYLDTRTGGGFTRLGRQPRALRYHGGVSCREAERHLPALVAAVVDAEGLFRGVHRTWIARDDAGVWRKADLRNAKMSLGAISGGHVPIWRGASGVPLSAAPDGEEVAIGEGIETCLSVAIACPDLRVIASVSLANLGGVHLPPAVTRVILLADQDENPAARAALQRAAEQHQAAGREVRIARPPVGRDFNDTLVAEDQAA